MKIAPVPPLHGLHLVGLEEPLGLPRPARLEPLESLAAGPHPLHELLLDGPHRATLADRPQQGRRLQLVKPEVECEAHERIKLRLVEMSQAVHCLLHIVEVGLQQVFCPVLRDHVTRAHVVACMAVTDGQHPRSVVIRLRPQTLKLLNLLKTNVTYSHNYILMFFCSSVLSSTVTITSSSWQRRWINLRPASVHTRYVHVCRSPSRSRYELVRLLAYPLRAKSA